MVSATCGTLTLYKPSIVSFLLATVLIAPRGADFRRAFAIGVEGAETRPAMASVAIDIDFFDGYQELCSIFHTCFCDTKRRN
jgi:hypothetical protein